MVGLRGIPASYGGVETAVEQLAPRLAASGVDVTVYTRSAYVEQDSGEYRGVRLRPAAAINTKHLEAISHTVCALFDAMRPSQRADLIHFHATGPALLAWIPKLAGVDTVVTIQGWDWRRGKWGRFAQLVLRLAAKVSVSVPDGVIGVSQQIVDDAARDYGRDISYIPNGVNPPAIQTGEVSAEIAELAEFLGDRPTALFLGRIVPEKEVLTLVKAFREISSPEARLVVAGPSSHSIDYVDQVRRAAALDPRVRVLGPQYDAAKSWLFERTTCFVQPSNLEGLPLTLLEAVGHGAFPVVSSIPPHLEAVGTADTVRAHASEPGDTQGLRLAIEAAFALDDAERAEVTDELRVSVQRRYDWDVITSSTLALYERVTGRTFAPVDETVAQTATARI